jgi:hypothetical protein
MHLPKRNFKFRFFKVLNRTFLSFYLNWLQSINIPSSGLNKRFAMMLKMEAMVLCVLMAIAIAVSARPAVTDRSYIDRVVVDQANGQATLLLVIDIPLEDALTKPL